MSKDAIKNWLTVATQVLAVVLSVGCLVGATYFYSLTSDKLDGYVTAKEFSTYKDTHDKWAAEALRGVEREFAAQRADLQEVKRDVRELLHLRRQDRAEVLQPFGGIAVETLQLKHPFGHSHSPTNDFFTCKDCPGLTWTNSTLVH